jgi:hypothetical protein
VLIVEQLGQTKDRTSGQKHINMINISIKSRIQLVFKKPSWLIMILLLCYNKSGAQAIDDSLQISFQEFQIDNLQEKIFVHTDRELYLNDELIWLKIYNVDGFLHEVIEISKIAYVELINKENKPILQAKIAIKDGQGTGSIRIPSSIPTDVYKLRVYTKWMQNFSSEFFFEKDLTIVNTRLMLDETQAVDESRVEVGIFPEGGNLVDGIESIVAIHATKNGMGVRFKGIVMNENSDTLAAFNSHKFGMGHFIFKPETNIRHYVLLEFSNGGRLIQDLPKGKLKGVRMKLKASRDTVFVNLKSSSVSMVYLLAHTRGVLKSIQQIELIDGSGNLRIPKDVLGDGITHFTLFDQNRKPLCERLYFKQPTHIFRIELIKKEEIYDAREKVSLNLKTSNEDNEQVSANLSMSVFRIDSMAPENNINISNYFWLSSDLVGQIESPDYYFRTGDEVAMNNLMLTHGWRRFNWDSLEDKRYDLLPEYVGHIVQGKISNKLTGLAGAGIQAYISATGKRTQFGTSRSGDDGEVLFDLKDFYDDGELIIQTERSKDSLFNLEIYSPFSVDYSNRRSSPFTKEEINLAEINIRNKTLKIQRVFNSQLEDILVEPQLQSKAFYLNPDVTFRLDDYVRFPKMEDVLREYVTPVMVRKRNNKFYLAVFEEEGNGSFPNEPLILLDGLPIFDTNRIMNYDPLKVERLEILKSQYFFRDLVFDGLLNFFSYDRNLTGFKLDFNTTVIDYDGLEKQREFYSTNYETDKQRLSRHPDFRTLLNWTPEIKTDKEGCAAVEFYTSDVPGNYAVIIQGITKDGKTGSKSVSFKVKD